ncbi:MAG: helix-turn-helix domain-containing protein [Acidimicrobiales bacterium]
MTEDFRLDGVRTPGRVCRIVAPTLLADVRRAHRAGHVVDPQVVAWVRAVVTAGEEWAVCARASDGGAPDRDPSPSERDLLTAADAASAAGCTASAIRAAVAAGRIEPCRRRPYLFERAEIDRFARARGVTP